MAEVIELGSRRELFVDDFLMAEMNGAALRLHHPVARDVALVTDRPWEGNIGSYNTVFRDNGVCRMYFQAWHVDLEDERSSGEALVEPHPMWYAYAESSDGIAWQRPDLGLFEHEGSRQNNVVWPGVGPDQLGSHGWTPFKDPNPDCDPAARYKAVGAPRRAIKGKGLYAMQSSDGLNWSMLRDEPVIRTGRFDSQNLAFYDVVRGEYRAYVRDSGPAGRDIRTATSKDFVNWTEPELLEYPGAPGEELYTNQVQVYARAPHIFVGFPARYVNREWSPAIEALPQLEHRRLRASVNQRFGTALTDGLFMSSRDGRSFKRWGEAFIRPGPQLEGNWAYGDNYQCCGMIETPSDLVGAPPELSVYATEGSWRNNGKVIRRYSLRMDGFVSANAPRAGGEFTTEPLTFEGAWLALNFSTSAAGSIRVEVQDGAGKPLDGFALDDCHEIIGDELERRVAWNGADLGALAGRTVRLRFVMSDADLYALQFQA